MNFELTAEQQTFRDAVRGFAERHLRAGALERAHNPEHPWDVARLMAGQGLLGITILEKDGGQGGALMDAVIAIETVAQACPRSADVLQAGNFGAIRVLAEYGNQAGFEIASEAMQIMGGVGYTQETLVEWCFRKCRGWMIAGGSIEILKNRIAEFVFDRTFSQRPSKPDKA